MWNNLYPAPSPTLRNLIVSIVFGVFIGGFLIFFEPFNINIAGGRDSIGGLMFYGVITMIVLVLFLYLLPLSLPKLFAEEQWTVKHQILYCSLILFTIATANGIYTNYLNSLSFSWANYWWIINRTFVLGSIPFSFMILLDSRRRENTHQQVARDISDQQLEITTSVVPSAFTITTDLKSETFTFQDVQFYYARAVGNYTDLYLFVDGELKSATYRVSLASFQQQVVADHLQRCHRSYFVNLRKVEQVTGNAQGLKLSLSETAGIIPVSRKYLPAIKSFFAATSPT